MTARENLTPLDELKIAIVGTYLPEDRRLPSVLVRHIPDLGSVTVEDLMGVMRETFAAIHTLTSEQMLQYPVDSFRKRVLQNLYLLLLRCAFLYRESLNPKGYMLKYDEAVARWDECPDDIQNFLTEHAEDSDAQTFFQLLEDRRKQMTNEESA